MKRVVLILGTVLLVIALPLTLILVMRNQEMRKKAAPATTLTLSPATVSKSVGDEFTLEAKMDTAENQIVAVEINLTFDPTKLEAEWIHNGTMFPNILSSGVVGNGTVSIALGATNTTTPITGTGTVATIKFKALASTQAPVSVRFSQDTFVGALNEGSTNALTSSVPATITISGSGGNQAADTNPTPTPSPTGTLGGTPTLTPILTPTLAASDSASPSAVTIVSPYRNESVRSTTPVIEGKAPPGSTVTIVIHSAAEITATVIADANGDWTYTVEQPLESGPHTINIAAEDPSTGATKNASISFVVSTGTENGASGSAIPVSGTAENTIMLLALGTILMILGGIVPAFSKRTL